MKKERLDITITQRGLCTSREQAKGLIMSGTVYVNGQREDKPGHAVGTGACIEIRGETNPYVSRGGLKLEKALEVFGFDPAGMRVLDVGASTGGFTDCLLKNGASHVTAVDVGYGQLAWALRNDERVTSLERVNIRTLTREAIGAVPDFAVIDVSFISLKLVLPSVIALLKEGGEIICLIKPQFEAGRGQVGKNGVIKDPQVHFEVLRNFCAEVLTLGYHTAGLDFSPVKGPKGNIEFLAYLMPKEEKHDLSEEKIRAVVEAAHRELQGERY
ncbi:MAG: TlyA family RNA methyltransferase [Oscillospiraceae bacterium]|nr:TlyA family RNA methyltransferase [Oscillospiraceae bacterium]